MPGPPRDRAARKVDGVSEQDGDLDQAQAGPTSRPGVRRGVADGPFEPRLRLHRTAPRDLALGLQRGEPGREVLAALRGQARRDREPRLGARPGNARDPAPRLLERRRATPRPEELLDAGARIVSAVRRTGGRNWAGSPPLRQRGLPGRIRHEGSETGSGERLAGARDRAAPVIRDRAGEPLAEAHRGRHRPARNPQRTPPPVRALGRRQLRRDRHHVDPLRQPEARRVEPPAGQRVPSLRRDGDPDGAAAGQGAAGLLAQAPARLGGSPRQGHEAERRRGPDAGTLDLEDPRLRSGEEGPKFFAERPRPRRAQRPVGNPEAALPRARRRRRAELGKGPERSGHPELGPPGRRVMRVEPIEERSDGRRRDAPSTLEEPVKEGVERHGRAIRHGPPCDRRGRPREPQARGPRANLPPCAVEVDGVEDEAVRREERRRRGSLKEQLHRERTRHAALRDGAARGGLAPHHQLLALALEVDDRRQRLVLELHELEPTLPAGRDRKTFGHTRGVERFRSGSHPRPLPLYCRETGG